ncbi:unnamed protein product [Urochloa humidicola]
MLQRFGMVMATSGLIPAALAVPDSMTAQRQLGLCPMVCTAEQQLLVGVDCGSSAAEMHGANRSATLSAEALPHSPVAVAPSTATPATTRIRPSTTSGLIDGDFS